ncbi:hypothetical protein IFT84_17450 [Rhizobium sp. CFBP 8762]|uniref:hypothetical protein n=1 Tax=Rhizobium sp. CFBP 8762 TaxID=2775279 RepID=UPI0017863F6B|nr:hypothetical protein [Rhizobium sp. CFBP 8762]MBD8556297.1 hypothetical protein [Rhizobium sp. CFBP 8762]
MIDVAIAIDEEAVAVTHEPRAPGAYVPGGRYVEGEATPVIIQATIQPTTGRQLMDMPEGVRTEARWMAWSRSEVSEDDHITHMGKRYRVLFLWPRFEGAFYRFALGLEKRNDE